MTALSASDALAFRDDRLSKMDSQELPVTLFDAPRSILHLVPASAFEAGAHVAVAKLPDLSQRHGPRGEEAEVFFNFDGVAVRVAGEEDASLSYVQMFRSGAVEIVHADLLTSDSEESTVDTARFERTLLSEARQWTGLQKELGARAPVFVMLSLLKVRGLSLDGYDRKGGNAGARPFDRDELVVPEAILASFDDDVARSLQPLFDAVWNAAGCARSRNFNQDGEWLGG